MKQIVTTTFLEMLDRGERRPPQGPRGDCLVQKAEIPSPELNRFLYTSVGARWRWLDRLSWSYERWMVYLDRPQLHTWVAYVAGTPAGYFELEEQANANVEIVYFGLLPFFISKGLGGHLLTDAVSRAWDLAAQRVWVHTCDLDHPAALQNYQKRGFRIFKTEEETVDVPAQPGEVWPGAGR